MSTTALPFMFIGISRQEVESGDTSVLSALLKLLGADALTLYREMVDIAIFGYDDDPRELYDVPEVRYFVRKLDAEFPYWCYFLSTHGNGLLFILYSLCTPNLPPETRDQVWRKEISDYLIRRGLPAMNHLCETAGCPEAEIMRLTCAVTEYITQGPNRSEGVTPATDVQPVWSAERTAKMRDLIRQLYSVVAALEKEFEGRKFTPDGHLVGSIGEVVAAYAFGLKLLPASSEGHDAVAPDGTKVQIKLTGGSRGVSLYGQPDHLIVLQLTADREFKTIYNGCGEAAWRVCGGEQKNGQRSVSLSALRKIPVNENERLEQIRDFPSLADVGEGATTAKAAGVK